MKAVIDGKLLCEMLEEASWNVTNLSPAEMLWVSSQIMDHVFMDCMDVDIDDVEHYRDDRMVAVPVTAGGLRRFVSLMNALHVWVEGRCEIEE